MIGKENAKEDEEEDEGARVKKMVVWLKGSSGVKCSGNVDDDCRAASRRTTPTRAASHRTAPRDADPDAHRTANSLKKSARCSL